MDLISPSSETAALLSSVEKNVFSFLLEIQCFFVSFFFFCKSLFSVSQIQHDSILLPNLCCCDSLLKAILQIYSILTKFDVGSNYMK